MKQSLQLRLGQQLTMTPQLQQAIRLLQLSAVELTLEVQQALESNMMLELAEDESGVQGDSQQNSNAEQGIRDGSAGDVETGGEASAASEQIPEDLPVDTAWDDIYTGMPSSGGGDFNGYEFENQSSAAAGLREHLLWQLNLSPLGEADRVIAMTIVDAINDDGYLTASAEELWETLGGTDDPELSVEDVEAVIRQVQALEPTGVAARDLKECLCLQLAQMSESDTPWLKAAIRLVQEHIDLLGTHDYAQLVRRMRLSKDELREVVAVIQSLNPRPGAYLDEGVVEYIVPDVFVRKVKDAWQVEINPETVPSLRVNQQYAAMIRRADNSNDNNSLKSHLQEARWLIKSLQSRSQTLLRVATAIVERQRAFLDHGEEAMKPLVLHDIAEELGMHESTISRVTTRKYMHTPRGIFELKYFFSSHVSTSLGGEASSTAIRAVIKKLIAAENTEKPLSDSKIAAVLGEKGINVARRTVAKYREGMGIRPSNERKRLA